MVSKQLTLHCAEITRFFIIAFVAGRLVRAEENEDYLNQLAAQHDRFKNKYLLFKKACF
jgi:hypothetical protein